MQIFKKMWAASLLVCAAVLLSGCNSSGSAEYSSFGNSLSSVESPAEVEPIPDDQLLDVAKKQFSDGNYGHAVRYYEKAVEIMSGNPEAWLGLAASYDRVHRFDLADRAYREAARFLSDRPEYYNNVGYSYLLRGDVGKARVSFLRAHELDPKNVVINNNLEMMRDGLNRPTPNKG
jgi:Flp pilus assembly protein TadD